MKLREAAYKGLPEKATRGRHFAVTRMSHVAGWGIGTPKMVFGTLRHELLPDAIKEAEALDYRLNATIVLTDKEVA